MKRLLLAPALLALVAALLAAGAAAAPAPLPTLILDPAKYCPTGQLVIDVTYNVVNDADTGARGNVWAQDSYTRVLQIVKTGRTTYCGGTRDTGTFVSLGGTSPGATASVAPGTTGTFAGGFRTTNFTATWRPIRPATGFLGTFDFGCDPLASCPGAFDWVAAYFTGVRGYGFARWIWNYDSTSGAHWSSTYLGSFGDLAG